MGSTHGRHLCKQQQPPASPIHVTMPRRGRGGNRWAESPMAGPSIIHVPTHVYTTSSIETSPNRAKVPNTTSDTMDTAIEMGDVTQQHSVHETRTIPTVSSPAEAATLGPCSSSALDLTSSAVVSRTARMKEQGFSDKVIARIEKSRAVSR